MFVADVKCSQATWQTVPNSRTGSAKASVSKAVVNADMTIPAFHIRSLPMFPLLHFQHPPQPRKLESLNYMTAAIVLVYLHLLLRIVGLLYCLFNYLSHCYSNHGTDYKITCVLSICRSVCPRSYGRNVCSILMKFCTDVGGPESKNTFVGVKIRWSLPYFAKSFTP